MATSRSASMLFLGSMTCPPLSSRSYCAKAGLRRRRRRAMVRIIVLKYSSTDTKVSCFLLTLILACRVFSQLLTGKLMCRSIGHALLGALFPVWLAAQSVTQSIKGLVTDTSAAVISNAKTPQRFGGAGSAVMKRKRLLLSITGLKHKAQCE